MRDTSAVCMAWPARSATTEPRICFPINARSPIRSRTLWRTNSSGEAQRRIQHLIAVQHDGILGGRSADQSLLPHGIGFMQKSKGARRRNLLQIAAISQAHAETLLADERDEES